VNVHLPYPEDEHEVRLMVNDPQALAYEWIKAYGANLSGRTGGDDDEYVEISADELINTAMTHVKPERSWGGDYIVRGGLLESVNTDPLFWDKLAILKEIDIPAEKRGNFFSCSC
jgi:hypothetical protein